MTGLTDGRTAANVQREAKEIRAPHRTTKNLVVVREGPRQRADRAASAEGGTRTLTPAVGTGT